jgi:L-seryl-tRNA(Ser) seleniumtransferase
VINATGVVLHTNLGRAPLSKAAIAAMDEAAHGYCTLEFDLERGRRGSRLDHSERLLQRLTGAEAALVVNNNAAAVMLVLAGLANRKRVVVSRTQLVEIGGGFRVPDVMRQSGAKLVEIGTTNRVHLTDFEEAVGTAPSLVLVAHRSNFQIVGFTEEPGLAEVATLCHRFKIPLVYDLGSGAVLDTSKYGLVHEPTVQEALRAGADLVCFSGDKLLGGPQSGIVVGRAELVSLLKRHPLARALRADKTSLAALSATLLHYLRDEAVREIPIWRMISLSAAQVKRRALVLARGLANAKVIRDESTVGGGSLPGDTLPTYVIALTPTSPAKLAASLRRQHPPIVARTKEDRVLVDLRTVLPEQESDLRTGLQLAMDGVRS